MGSETIALGFIGRLNDPIKMAGVGASMIFVNVTIQSTLTGLNNALTVLISIAYGYKDYERCELLLSRGRLLSAIGFIPVCILSMFCGKILLMINFEPEVAAYAQEFTIFLAPAMFFHM